MKKNLLGLAVASFLAGLALTLNAKTWTEIPEPGKIVPASGEYAILISKKTSRNSAWAKVAETLKKRYAGTLVVWDEQILDAEAKLKEAQPRYIAVVAQPEEVDRVMVADLHRMTRRLDPDFYGDAIFGIITARTPADAARLVEEQKKPLLIERGVSTTNCDRERFKRHFFITDWGENEYVETKNGVSGEKKTLPKDKEIVELFAKKFAEINPQYLLSASHATEFNLEMPFGRGLISPANGKFYCFKTGDLNEFRHMLGKPEMVADYAKKAELTALKANDDPKIWIAAGNCLFGDVLRNPDSVAATLLSDYGVRQLVGYTVPTWYGVGWDVHGNFFNGHQDITVGQAWFFANQASLEKLPPELRNSEYLLRADDMTGVDFVEIQRKVARSKVSVTRDNVGRYHDRDVIAFYGDPLFRSAFDVNAKNCQPWKYRLFEKGNKRRIVVEGTQRKERTSEFRFWFPEQCDVEKGIKFFLVKKNPKSANNGTGMPEKEEIDPAFTTTKNFLMLSNPLELAPDERFVIEYSVQ